MYIPIYHLELPGEPSIEAKHREALARERRKSSPKVQPRHEARAEAESLRGHYLLKAARFIRLS